ncbi:hypothetical protein ACGFMM_23970 [Streptomyces sp. NPDC048604]|uniref:hypothetical protein n=1 Tax=Streptomyces sp. NPDC048604 TaxID=3365578 RepID=UPI00371D47E9
MLLAAAGEWVLVFLWAPAPAPIACGGLGAHASWELLREAWALRTRGITVEGRLQGSDVYNGTRQYTYAYVDADGVTRVRTGADGGAERADITYDPEDPENTSVGGRATGQLVLGAVIFLLSGAVLLAGAGVVVAGLVALVA